MSYQLTTQRPAHRKVQKSFKRKTIGIHQGDNVTCLCSFRGCTGGKTSFVYPE